MDDSSFEAMAAQIEGLLGIDPTACRWKPETVAVHGYQGREPRTGAVSYPIYQSATFAHPALNETTGYAYSRCGNPTVLELENTIAQLEGGIKALAFASGLAAVSTVLKSFVAGDHLIVSLDLYGGTYRLFNDVYTRYGVEFSFIDFTDLAAVEQAIRPNTRAFFVETPTNPTMSVVDLRATADLAHAHGALLVVDNTFLTPYFQRPFDHGADLVVYSGTKYLCGHNDVICGFAVIKDAALLERVFMDYMSEGAALAPFEAWLMLRSLKTLGVRLERQQRNALELCRHLKSHPHVTDVHYVGDSDHPQYDVSCRQTTGFGAMISFNVDTPERAHAVLERVELIAFAESLGGCESLVTYPLVQTHGSMPKELRDRLGIGERFLRLSVGLEDASDLIADLDRALASPGR
ncbi:trans-sulfuration enzyme family protein [Berryella wangjianweii]|uniref:trans-sulfuration enzyme family protein n=1 Tax=Berryella wangjianweii TaxID=2734634 RepID=UPI0021BDEB92|nr:PLP-dependent aspartate aminotransferase family protein [Berryella wangjianweii]